MSVDAVNRALESGAPSLFKLLSKLGRLLRGISSGGESTLGANPSVAVYLDEQPVTAVGSYMNPHIYDVQRIEVLAGPQGTLFGANAQSGALRIITNQPDPTAREFGVNFGALTPKSGDVGFTAEGFANIPLSDRAAIRLAYRHNARFMIDLFDDCLHRCGTALEN